MPDIPRYDPFTKHFDPKPHQQPDDTTIQQACDRAVQAAHEVIEEIAAERHIGDEGRAGMDIADQILHNKNVAKWKKWEETFVTEAAFDYRDLRRHAARLIINGADHAETCAAHKIDPDEMGEHLEFMAPYVHGEHVTAAAIHVRQGGTEAEACELHGVTPDDLAERLKTVLRA